MKKNKIVSTKEPMREDVNGATNHAFFLKLSKTWTSKSCATKNAVPEPIAILMEIKSLKFVEKNRVNANTQKKANINYFSCISFSIFPVS